MADKDFISAAVVTYNDNEKAVRACKSILANTVKYPLKLYVIDNASSDDTVKLVSDICGVEVIKNAENIGFGAAHNKMLDGKLGKYHFVINPDILINSDVLSDMADFFENNPDIVMAMPKILNEDSTEQLLPKEIPTLKYLAFGRLSRFGGLFKRVRDEYTHAAIPATEVTDIKFCSGCFFCIRSDIFQKIGGFDKRYFMYMEDVDLTLEALSFGRVVINPSVNVTHYWQRESAKSLKYLFIHINSSLKFLRKWRNKKS